jgi:predicted secreted hydrolase
MPRLVKLFGAALIVAVILLLVALWPQPDPQVQARLIDLSGASSPMGYARATGPLALQFPADHGPHPDYQTEWWYYTGNLSTDEGRRFGYQLTFFRRAIVPPEERNERASQWAPSQLYMAHFAITDVAGKRHQAYERFSRGAAGLAGAMASPYQVWLEDWAVQETGPGEYSLYAAQSGISLRLTLIETRDPVLQGEIGYSQKGPDLGNASYYYSLTRLASSGSVELLDEVFAVEGLSWMDHEFSTSALTENQVGWDWFALQLDGGSDLMVFQIRQADGAIDPFSSGTLVLPDGTSVYLNRDDFAVAVQDTWSSPHTGAVYPAGWRISIPQADLTLDVTPLVSDQELRLSYAYWEGAVQITGENAGIPVSGVGYVELTGYAESMQRQF